MLRTLLTTMLLGPVFFAACATEGEREVATEQETIEETAPDTAMVAAEEPLPTWQVALEPTAVEFDVAGEGRVNALPENRTRATVEIRNAKSGAQHPWHVHQGQCESNGPIVGDAAAYPVLTADADGNASAEATLDVALEDDANDYYINIHKSPEETDTIVACGELRGTY